MKTKLMTASLVSTLAIATLAHADVTLIDDGFASGSVSTTTDGFRMREYSIDDGWQAARQGGGSDWTITGGTLQNASTVNTNGYPNYIPGEAPVAQAVSLGGLGISDSETELSLSFDYAVGSGDTLYVTLWAHTGTYNNASSNIYANLEARYGLWNNESSTTLDTFNLLDGATSGFGGTTNPLVALAGGTSGSYATTIDLTTLGITGVTKANDITAITIGFGKAEDGNGGVTSIDNLNLTAVPEPGSLALLGLGGLLIARRRRG